MSLPQGTVRWTFDSYGTNAVTPAFARNRLFVGGASVCALDPATGAALWESATDDIADCTPVVADGIVYAAGGDLRALDAETGETRWRRPSAPEGGFHHADVADAAIYVGAGAETLRACDAATGRDMWHAALGGHVLSPPRVAEGTLYVACVTGLHALDPATGAQRWSTDADGGLTTAAAVADGRVFIGLGMSDGRGSLGVRCLDAATGRTVWHAPTPGFVGGPPVLDGDVVYATEASGGVLALDIATGEPRRHTEIDDAGHGLALAGNAVYVCGIRSLTVLDAVSGTPLWSAHPDAFGLCAPLVLDNAVVLCDDAGLVHAVTPPTLGL
ncbi:PQQ-binding-like beta-propeller repeat protein [Yinghuangia sp. ASG 101]|uniref:outer membrane protein assembly factor BamB family protein n=1 Tax=Yinghuangia sp. ASG 101 TaxID=2896848 RepID=UPI001E3A641B|nr:PQQ-binding-like beta-propeller repeat protein [Yinghuangia sp. ASG 101]UGQ11546.1 PQQ-binding-like beta-propeller repeat protein [Yinghuangia sp. ASG 101]